MALKEDYPMFRKLHRWFSLPLFVFVLIVLGTGVALQVK